MNLTSKTDNKILLITVNILLLVGFLFYFLTDIVEYMPIRNIELYFSSIFLLTLITVKKEYGNNPNIKGTIKPILPFFYILIGIILMENILWDHFKMALDIDSYLDNGSLPKGETEAEFRQKYQEYRENFTSLSSIIFYFILILNIIYKIIFYTILSIFSLCLLLFIMFQLHTNRSLTNTLFILPVSTPLIIFIKYLT